MRCKGLKLGVSLALLYSPLVLADCPKRTVLVPRNKKFHELCGADPDHPENSVITQPCFKLENGNLHDITLGSAEQNMDSEPPESFLIVKDGDLTDFTPLNSDLWMSINWVGTGVQLGYSGIVGGCHLVWLLYQPTHNMKLIIKDQDGKEIAMDHTTKGDQKPGRVCSRWIRLSLEKI
ncbi:uncharacterized protein UTRI_03995 [Ustilago trichophora]|uniref:Mig1 protein n=1 Tax=Ustilago trichophora TaxID=86804 RepID=A0A5C3EA61_9BASI|nr:uncharacterized protein UTRI_03995 [Ustilago trichophora]